ncbi:thiamine biosynthesis protein ThiF [Loktanella sp. S4079]|nr:HesA/MoeB/ThiF family protein [Loktanella sp. S4079]KJZ18056.1 thiamine biosynthesis protein ThiF [Loktanella sp. S4079]
MGRYHRQMILPEVGTKGQLRLQDAHVLVVGAGGLGCPALQYLSGAGVGRISIIDHDHVELSNLHRQPLFGMADLGQPKAEIAANKLREANPATVVTPHVAALTPANVTKLCDGVDVVVDAADSFAVTYTLSDHCHRQRMPLIAASALGLSGYVGAFCGNAPSLRAVFPSAPGTSARCTDSGVLGPVVGMIGTMQAQMTLQVLLGHQPSPLGILVNIDMRTHHFSQIDFCNAPEPDVLFPFISISDIAETDQIIDLRPETESPTLAHPRAVRWCGPLADYTELSTSRRTVICCKSGLRAWRTAEQLAERGLTNICLHAAEES